MYQRKRKLHPKNWQESETEEGILYTLNSDVERTCLVKYDMTVEIRANGLISEYPSIKEIESGSELKNVLETIEKARFCVGSQEGRNCKNVLFPARPRSGPFAVRCQSCRVKRGREIQLKYSRKRRLDVSHENKEKRACIVKNCPGRDTAAIRLFAIPEMDIEAWCHNLKLDVSEVNENVRVCSRHFKDEYKNPRTLKAGARPTVNLGQDEEVLESDKLLDRIKYKFCCIAGCNRRCPPHTLHRFPSKSERLKQWLLICVIKDEMIGNRDKFICSKHFEPSMLHSSDRLKSNAIPKMDAISWLENYANTENYALEAAAAVESTQVENNSELAPEVQAIKEIQKALKAKIEGEDEIKSLHKSDSFQGLQCKNFCVTCATAFKDCETFREACDELEKQLQELKSKTEELREQNEKLMTELESNSVVLHEEVEIEIVYNE